MYVCKAVLLTMLAITISIRTLTLYTHTIAATSDIVQNIYINEFLPDPVGSDALGEWVELFNASGEIVELVEWKFGNSSFSAEIEPWGYLILARNAAHLAEIHPDFDNIIQVSMSMPNAGGTLTLYDELGDIIDQVFYGLTSEGRSFERVGSIESDQCNLWEVHEFEFTINALNDNFDEKCWEREFDFLKDDLDESFGGDGTEEGSELEEEIGNDDIDDDANENQSEEEIIVEYRDIMITEIFPSPSPDSGFNEWIEIYNFGDQDFDIANWYISKSTLIIDSQEYCSPVNPFSDSIFITQSQSHLVIESKLNIVLNNSGTTIYLCDELDQIVDKVAYPNTKNNFAYSRVWDGETYTDQFVLTGELSKGEYNLNTYVSPIDQEEQIGESQEHAQVNSSPITLTYQTVPANVDGKLIYTEGEIIGNFGSSFDISTPIGLIRIGFANIDNPTRSKGDHVKVTGIFEIDGDVLRLSPRSNSDLIIISRQENDKNTSANTKATVKTSTRSSGANVKNSGTLPSSVLGTSISLEDPNILLSMYMTNDDLSEVNNISRSMEMRTLMLQSILLILILISLGYLVYTLEIDKKLIDLYNQSLKGGNLEYFRPRKNVQKEFIETKENISSREGIRDRYF